MPCGNYQPNSSAYAALALAPAAELEADPALPEQAVTPVMSAIATTSRNPRERDSDE